jgi:hypothetical protein
VLFYKNFYIYGDMSYEEALAFKEYLYGTGTNRKHLNFLEKFTDFRKCMLDNRDFMKECTYGVVNLSKDTRDIVLGPLAEEADRFVPTVYLPKKSPYETLEKPSSLGSEANQTRVSETDWTSITLEEDPLADQSDTMLQSTSQGAAKKKEGLDSYFFYMIKIGNYLVPMLCRKVNKSLEDNFASLRANLRLILENCERLLLNQMTLVESTMAKKNSVINAFVYNTVNKSIVYYPFNKFTVVGLPPKLISEFVYGFSEIHESEQLAEKLVYLDGCGIYLYKWNSRILAIFSDDKRGTLKDFEANVKTFKDGLGDIFI